MLHCSKFCLLCFHYLPTIYCALFSVLMFYKWIVTTWSKDCKSLLGKMHFIQKIVFNRTVSGLIVLLELLTVLLEYIDLFLIQNFDNQRFIALVVYHKNSSHYASIMLNAFRHLSCSKLCQHSWRVPTCTYLVVDTPFSKFINNTRTRGWVIWL